MTEAEARGRLERLVAPDAEPQLDVADVDELVERAKRPDSAGLSPTDPAWVPTWDLDAAAAIGWEVKAGRAASMFTFSEDGQSFRRNEIHESCKAMARMYRRGAGSVALPAGRLGDYLGVE